MLHGSKMKQSVGLVVIASIIAVAVLICGPMFYARWILFIPITWVSVARPLIWVGSVGLLISYLAVRDRCASSSEGEFSRNFLVVVVGATLLGFLMSEIFFGYASVLNRMGAKRTSQCFVLDSRTPGNGAGQRLLKANVSLPRGADIPSPTLRYVPSAVDLSSVKPGESFMLEVRDGFFGYNVIRGQRAVSGCSKEESALRDLP